LACIKFLSKLELILTLSIYLYHFLEKHLFHLINQIIKKIPQLFQKIPNLEINKLIKLKSQNSTNPNPILTGPPKITPYTDIASTNTTKHTKINNPYDQNHQNKQRIQNTLTIGPSSTKTHTPLITKQHHPVLISVHRPSRKIRCPNINTTNHGTQPSSNPSSNYFEHHHQTNFFFSLETKKFSHNSTGLPKDYTPQNIPKINPKEERTKIFHLPIEKMDFLRYGYRKNCRKRISGDDADAEPWPAGPAVSSAQSGGQPTGWVFFLPPLPLSAKPPNLSLISNSRLPLRSV
jgi:hypothetical protein